MKKIWVIPIVLCILLLVVWPMRWEKRPSQTKDGLTMVHLRDRWTGQKWISFYGTSKGKMYSGDMVPYSDIAKKPMESLKDNAIRNRDIATIVWASLLGLSFITSVFFLIRTSKKDKREERCYQI